MKVAAMERGGRFLLTPFLAQPIDKLVLGVKVDDATHCSYQSGDELLQMPQPSNIDCVAMTIFQQQGTKLL